MKKALAVLVLAFAGPAAAAVLDDFEDVSRWTAAPSDGVRLKLGAGEGFDGRALCLDIDYGGSAGYAIARRALPLDLPANYRFRFRLRGDLPPNTLEFKLVDPSGENVWWVRRPDVTFPNDRWGEWRFKKRHVSFAWGPQGGGEMTRVGTLELAITASAGGKGRVCIDDLVFEELPPDHPYTLTPAAAASSSAPDNGPENLFDGDPVTGWRSGRSDLPRTETVVVDFGEVREFGGLVLDWDAAQRPPRYLVDLSEDGTAWDRWYEMGPSRGSRDWLYLPEAEARLVRFEFRDVPPGQRLSLRALDVRPLAFSGSPNAFYAAIAKESRRGAWPRGLVGELGYWTVVGPDGDPEEALFDEDGALEPGAGSFRIEPFLVEGGRVIAWSDAERTRSLAGGYLPLPGVTWRAGGLRLEIEAFASGPAGAALLVARYRLVNETEDARRVRLALALRPFQVNPPSQFLNAPGGHAPVHRIGWDGTVVPVDDAFRVVPLAAPSAVAVTAASQNDLFGALVSAEGIEPVERRSPSLADAGAVLAYDFDLEPGAVCEVALVVPYRGSTARPPGGAMPAEDARRWVETRRQAAIEEWRARLDKVQFTLPPDATALADTVRSTLAYVLINRDGPAIQPGSRAYSRSWIRDGSLTSSALLRLGEIDAARAFAEWFAPYQYADGKVPCCVDRRGADPVPENDSHGQLIHLVAEVWRFTNDRAFADRMWPHVLRAVDYIDALRQTRRTDAYRAAGTRAFFGLLPESISHEGYSAKPMHSYWDDFFALRGLKDAAELAVALGRPEAPRMAAMRDEFRTDLHASIRAAIARHGIDHIPGCVELGDFDPTSTTVGITPADEAARLPARELRAMYDRYMVESRKRARGERDWDAYTPYEWRTVGTLVRLGRRDDAHEMIRFFMGDRRPPEWNHWAEVVWRDPRAPKFIGDMPHTWVGSDFVRSILDLFAYEREDDHALVLGAGITPAWARSATGAGVKGLRTPYGAVEFHVRATGSEVRASIGAGLKVPPGGVVLAWPLEGLPARATVDGRSVPVGPAGEVVVRGVPAEVVVSAAPEGGR